MNKHVMAVFVAFVIVLVVVALPILVGATFGQRCERAFPNNALQAEMCVYRLARGRFIHKETIK